MNTRPQSRPEAELPEVPEPDGFIKRPSAANSHNRSEPYCFASKLRAYGQQCAATRPAEVGGDGWLPIESAPKDGRVILAYNGEVTTMYWVEGDGYSLWVYSDELLRDACPDADQPAHWKPLPPAPGSDVKS